MIWSSRQQSCNDEFLPKTPFIRTKKVFESFLSVCGVGVFRDFKAKDFEDAKLQANELIYDALRWNR